MAQPFDVVGVGINSIDRVLVLPAFPTPSGPGSKLRVLRAEIVCGGQTATAMAACARLGLRTKYVGATGRGADGALVRDTLSGLGVDVSHLALHDAVNRYAVILIDERDGERVVLWDFDDRLALADSEIPSSALVSARVVHVDDVDERAAISAARTARSAGVTVTSDIDQVTDRTAELLDTVTVGIFAQHAPCALAQRLGRGHSTSAARGLTSEDEVREALVALPRRREQAFCVTLGHRGALALDNEGFHHVPAFRVSVTDTTAAGDVFRAGFIYALLRGWKMVDRLRFANAAAAISCTRLGAIPSAPSLEEVERLLAAR